MASKNKAVRTLRIGIFAMTCSMLLGLGTTPADADILAPQQPIGSGAVMPDVPRRELIHRVLFEMYYKQENFDAAAQELDELLKLKPESGLFQYAYADVMQKQKKYPEAIQHLQEAVKSDPTYPDYYAIMGDCQLKMKKYKEALDSFTQAQQHARQGQNFNSKINLAQQYYDRQKQEEDYLKQINKVVPKKK
jgi:tetratricopeptide (TPR) repeat protein